MKSTRLGLLLAGMVYLGLALIGGCPPTNGDSNQPTDGNDANDANDANTPFDTSIFTVVKTNIAVFRDASLKCGDDLIAFGTGSLNGISYIVPSANPATATAIPGDFRSVGFTLSGKKILMFSANRQLTVYDTQTTTMAQVPLTDVSLESLPTNDEEELESPVIADGALVVTRNVAAEVDDGRVLKLIDVSVDPPVVTALQNPPENVLQMVVSSADHLVITFGDNKFFVYDTEQPTAAPQTIDLALQDGIAGPFAYDDGYILYLANAIPDNVRLLKLTEGNSITLTPQEAQRLLPLVMRGGKYGYFLDRDAFDIVESDFRVALGVVPQTSATAAGAAGDPALQTLPWVGFGRDAAFTTDGKYLFISGDGAIDDTSEFLQVSDGGVFGHFVDGAGFLNAADVDVSATLVGFKIGVNENTKLGYIVLPD
jgi:hypothetical protein